MDSDLLQFENLCIFCRLWNMEVTIRMRTDCVYVPQHLTSAD